MIPQGVMMIIYLPGHVHFLGEAFMVPVYRRNPAYY